MTTTTKTRTSVLSSSTAFKITQRVTITTDDSTGAEVSRSSEPALLEVRQAPDTTTKSFTVYVKRDGVDTYSALLVGITGLRTDVNLPGAVAAGPSRSPALDPATGARIYVPGTGPLCMRGSAAGLPDAMADAVLQLMPEKKGLTQDQLIERAFGKENARSTVAGKVRRAIEAAGLPPNPPLPAGRLVTVPE